MGLGDVMYSTVTIANNIVLSIWKSLREWIFKVLTQEKSCKYMWWGRLTRHNVRIILQYMHILKSLCYTVETNIMLYGILFQLKNNHLT